MPFELGRGGRGLLLEMELDDAVAPDAQAIVTTWLPLKAIPLLELALFVVGPPIMLEGSNVSLFMFFGFSCYS